jgi:hydroxyacid-oxoacid transhydrogenase
MHKLMREPGMSYPISSQNPAKYSHPGYNTTHTAGIIPHGVSVSTSTSISLLPAYLLTNLQVAVTSPSVFAFTGASNPLRHLQAAECFGVDISNVPLESAGEVLSEALKKFLELLGDQPRGLKDLGFTEEMLDDLVEGTLPQRRVLMLAPGLAEEVEEERGQLRALFQSSMVH